MRLRSLRKGKYMLSKLLVAIHLICFTFISSGFAQGKPKSVLFIAHTENLGGKGVLNFYAEFKKRGFDVKVAGIPLFVNEKLWYELDHNFFKKFQPDDVVFPCGTKEPYSNTCSGFDKKYDYVIIQNPYDGIRGSPKDTSFLFANLHKIADKIAYIVYGPHIFHQAGCNNTRLKDYVNVAFVDSESTKKLYVENLHFPASAVQVSGYQNYKNVREKMPKIKADSNYKETILWMPRWTLHFNARDGHESGSTFLSYHYFFYNYAKKHPEIKLIIRPHTNLFKYAVQSGFMSQEDVDEIIARFKSLKNVSISDHKDMLLEDDVLASNIVISDGTSALGEVIVARKPVIYLSNGWDNEFNSNELGKELKQNIYLAHDPEQIENHLNWIRNTSYAPYEIREGKGRLTRVLHFFGIRKESKGYESFRNRVDPVENPASFIADYIENH